MTPSATSPASTRLAEARRSGVVLAESTPGERQSFAKYLTIAKIKLENAIAVVRASEPRESIRRDIVHLREPHA